ncbi:hypothetical protein DL93DRAFT_1326890 [Clavulina sp. PMI_390]|nr:hypothetical protein DL93DRAFT_1326890 [Clavulina sp. PMI_390]
MTPLLGVMSRYAELPPEIRALVTELLDLPDLRNYSVSCQCFAREASRLLWRNEVVAPYIQGDEGIRAVVQALLQNPIKGSYTRQIRVVTTHRGEGFPPTIFTHCTDSSEDPLWPRLTSAFQLLVNLKAITISMRYAPSLMLEVPPRTQRMVDCLIDARLSTIKYLRSSLPTRALVGLFQAWPALRTVATRQPKPSRATVPSDILLNLRQIQAHLPWLDQLVQGRPIERIFVPPTSNTHERSPEYAETLGRILSQSSSLKHLRIHWNLLLEGGSIIKLSHPGIMVLELVLWIDEIHNEEEAYPFITLGFQGFLRELPSL